MRTLPRVAMTLVATLLLCQTASADPSAPNAQAIDRLLHLGRLWGDLKYLHPQLARADAVDWDAALNASIPRVESASTTAAYSNALQDLLATLDDPLTRIVQTAPAGIEDS